MDADLEETSHERPAATPLPVPVTLSGVAALAQKSNSWLLAIWVVLAVAASACLLWFINDRWLPVVEAEASQFPASLRLENGQVQGLEADTRIHQQNGFLSVVLTDGNPSSENLTADFQLTLTPAAVHLQSIFGTLEGAYPVSFSKDLSPDTLLPWWQARKWMFTILTATLLVAYLLFTWIMLATLYTVPLRILCFVFDRRSSIATCWRLGGSALIPGALIMTVATLLYGLQLIGLLALGLATVLHLILPWGYAFGATRRLPAVSADLSDFSEPAPEPPSDNPFAPR